eukprot:TRINITY_DN48747_c0_g1_i1.p1 TRINITY_DN48747_c0_g1~~TRINITY_DN48747_c0_g1_i1.p1  ORF type:complete len:122 (-),score=20.82 TRINITY_DN48747_c0_g1_i1:27-392(-)
MLRSLVGSEMCIRDSLCIAHVPPLPPGSCHCSLFLSLLHSPLLLHQLPHALHLLPLLLHLPPPSPLPRPCSLCCSYSCLLYTSDAADEEDSVDLGGRRIIKKKKRKRKREMTKYIQYMTSG